MPGVAAPGRGFSSGPVVGRTALGGLVRQDASLLPEVVDRVGEDLLHRYAGRAQLGSRRQVVVPPSAPERMSAASPAAYVRSALSIASR